MLKTTFMSLETRLSGLCEGVTDLRLTLQEDHPPTFAPVLTDLLSDAGEALLASLEEALVAAGRAQTASRTSPADLAEVCRALLGCHGGVQSALENAQALLSFERRSQLLTLGQERGKAWRAWSQTVLRRLEGLEQTLLETSAAVLEAWRELSERLLERGVFIRATNIGQQLRVPGSHIPSFEETA